MDIITIHDLKITTTIGVLPWERQVKQTLFIDVSYAVDCQKVAESDALEHSVDYNAIAEQLTHFVETHSFHLLETLAEKSVLFLAEQFSLTWIKLHARKLAAVSNSTCTSVTLERDF